MQISDFKVGLLYKAGCKELDNIGNADVYILENGSVAKIKIVSIILIIILLGTILYFFNPESSIWFPKCPFYLLTGYQCPACGIQRAAYQLLHFHIKEAFYYNPFLVISVPYALLLIWVTWIVPHPRFSKLRAFCYHAITVKTYVLLTVIWWIVRNL